MRCLWTGCLLLVLLYPLESSAEFESSSPPPSTAGREGLDRFWDLSIRPFLGYDDNVQLVPDQSFFDGDTESFFGGLNVKASVRAPLGPRLTVAAAAAIENVWYAEDQSDPTAGVNSSQDDYNLAAVSPTLAATYADRAGDVPFTLGAQYAFRFEDGDVKAIGLEENTFGLSATAQLTPRLGVALGYRHQWSRFDVSFPGNNALNGRDADTDSIDLSARYRWDRGRRSISVGYGFTRNNADGKNFDYDAHEISTEFSSLLIASLWGRVSFSARFADYDGPGFGFIAIRRKEQYVFDSGVALVWVFCPNLSADVFYQRQDIESNTASFEYDRNNVGAGLTYRF